MSDEEPTRPWRTVALAEADAENQRLSAENERLREALEAIAGATTIADAVPEVRQFARDALAATSLPETVKCSWGPCSEMLRRASGGGGQWCSKAHRSMTLDEHGERG